MEGKIIISLKRDSTNHLSLIITDNGIGLPAGFNGIKRDSMGMNLMRGLSEEIGASFSINNENGTCISVSFTYNPEVTAMIPEPSHII
jgi:two-component sensor histidine kinase